MKGTIYSETVVWSPPAELAAEAPYQLVLVQLENGSRVMGRMTKDNRVSIGDSVILDETKDHVHLFRIST